jgi:hypothetical protein
MEHSPEDESVAYRVLALTLVAGLSLSSAALAKEQCPVGEVYFRSKHICVAKGTPVGRKIYHYRPPAAKVHEAATIHRRTPPGKAATVHRLTPPRKAALPAKVPLPPRVTRTANSAAEIPLPPPRPMRSDAASPPARSEAEAISGGGNAPAAPEITHPSASPYGELVPVTPGE